MGAKSTAYVFGNNRNSADLQIATRITEHPTVKSGFLARWNPQDDWSFLRTLAVGKRKKPSAVYTIGDFEPMVYDCKHHIDSSGLLMEKEIIAVFQEEKPDSITPGVWRCFQDRRVKLADALMLLSVFVTGIITPLTFIWGGTWGDPQVPGGVGLLVMDLLVDIVFACWLALQLNVSFLHPGRRLEMCNRRKIIHKCLKSPSYWACCISASTYFWVGAAGAPLFLNNLKIVRMHRLVILPDSLWRFRDNSFLLVIRPTFLLIFLSHWVACLLACMGGYREHVEEHGAQMFRTSMDGNSPPDRFSAYLMAFVEAIYMLTGAMDNPLGDGGAREKSFGNLVLVAILGPIGIVIISLVIANVVRMSNLQNALGIRHEETKAFIARALENLDIPKDLQRRVFSLHYFQRLNHDFEAFGELFKKKNLSAPLEIALRIYLYHESFLHSGYFKDKDTNYILEVVRCLDDRIFVPGDYIIRRGEVGCEMFFVGRGLLSVRIPHHREDFRQDLFKAYVGAEIGKGAYFGEIALVADCLRTAWVCAETYVILSELRRQSIEVIWKYFPHEREILIKTITDNTMRNRKDAMSRLWRNVAKRGVASKRQMDGRCEDPDESADRFAMEYRQTDGRAMSELLSCPAKGTEHRSATEELEARYKYAKDQADLLEGIQAKSALPKPPDPDDEGLNYGSIMRHFDRCCAHLLRSQNDVTAKIEKLTGDMDDLSHRQSALAKQADASAVFLRSQAYESTSTLSSQGTTASTVKRGKWNGRGSGDASKIGLGGILELAGDQEKEVLAQPGTTSEDAINDAPSLRKLTPEKELPSIRSSNIMDIAIEEVKPSRGNNALEGSLELSQDGLGQPTQYPRQSPETPEGSTGKKTRRVKGWRRGEAIGKPTAAGDVSEEKESLTGSAAKDTEAYARTA